MAKTIRLTGRLADITSRPVEEITTCTVKAPSFRPGPGVEITTSQPIPVNFDNSGSFSIDVVEGLGWLYIDGGGWSDSIKFVASEGMTTFWEAVVNSMPYVLEVRRLLIELGKRYEESRLDLLSLARELQERYARDLRITADELYARLSEIVATSTQGKLDDINRIYEEIKSFVYAQTDINDASIHGVLANEETQSRKLLGELSHSAISTHNAGAGSNSFNTREVLAGEPYLYDDRTLFVDDADRIVDGAQFFTMIRVGDRPGEWLDEYYGYVSGHGYGFTTNEARRMVTWLVTAPSPYGPWKWQKPVMGTRLGETTSRSYVVGPGCLAPDVMWVGDEIWLNYHGGKLTQPWVEDYDYANRWGAPSVLAKSTDGINFVEDGIAIDIDRGVNDLSPYRASTSYRRTIRVNGVWHTVWQANTTNTNEQIGDYGYSVGYAISHDGVNWKKQPPLLGPEAIGDQGPFSPSLTKVAGGWLLVVSYRRKVGTSQVGLPRMYFAEELRPGAFKSLGDLHLPERPGGREQRQVQSPFFFHYEGVLHMAYGNTPRAGDGVGIQLAKVGFK